MLPALLESIRRLRRYPDRLALTEAGARCYFPPPFGVVSTPA